MPMGQVTINNEMSLNHGNSIIGHVLAQLINRLTGEKSTVTCGCSKWIRRMNEWGPEGCRKNIDRIVKRLIFYSRKHGWKFKSIPGTNWVGRTLAYTPGAKQAAKQLVLHAIRQAEKQAKTAKNTPPDLSEVDAVIPLGNGCGWGDYEELRYALRSLETNLHGLRSVFIVGGKPGWLSDKVFHIPAEDVHKRNKDANLIDKVVLACERPELSPWFVRLSDDQLVLRPTRLADMRPLFGNALKAPRSKNDKWFKRFDNTLKLLTKAGHETRNYDNHAPMPVEKESFLRIAKTFDYQKLPGCTINTLYFNAYGKLQAVPVGTQAGFISGDMDETKIRRMMLRFRYLGYTDKGLTKAFKAVLQEKFPTPSRFEKP